MKQYITAAQAEELTAAQDERLQAWAAGHHYSRLMSVGQMIAFIDEHLGAGWYDIERDRERRRWRVVHEAQPFDEGGEPELCDLLWGVVRGILADRD